MRSGKRNAGALIVQIRTTVCRLSFLHLVDGDPTDLSVRCSSSDVRTDFRRVKARRGKGGKDG